MTYCDPCLPLFKNISLMATFRIFRRVQLEHTWNAMFCNFPLNFAVWPQPSRFLKAEVQICTFLRGCAPCLRGSAPCLRACFFPECISLLLKTCRWYWREKLQKFGATAAEQRVALPLKTGWRDVTSTSGGKIMAVFLSYQAQNGALKPLICWTFPWEIWFTNVVDMIVPLYTTSAPSAPSAPSALSALFGSFWVVFPKRGSQSKKS